MIHLHLLSFLERPLCAPEYENRRDVIGRAQAIYRNAVLHGIELRFSDSP